MSALLPGETLEYFDPKSQFIFDSSGNMVGLQNPRANGGDLRGWSPTQYDRVTGWSTLSSNSVRLATQGNSPIRDLLTSIYPDPQTETLITSIAPPTTAGKTNYRVLIGAMKKLGIWSSLANGFLFGSAHQASATTQKSINGGNDATGTGTQASYYASMNGTTNKFTYAGTADAASEARTIVAVFLDSNTSSGHVSHAWSMYSGGAAKGPAIYSGGSTISGTTGTTNKVFGFGSLDGSASTGEMSIASATYGGIVYSALRQMEDRQILTVQGKQQTYASLASLWMDATDRVIGASGAGSQFLAGQVYAMLEFSTALTDAQLETLTFVLRYIFGNNVSAGRYLAFEGNSLTASAAGGGTTWPAKLMAKTAWANAFTANMYSNVALDGAQASTYNEQTYYMQTAQWRPVVGERNILFAWEGVNDITAGYSTAKIVAAIDRHLAAAFRDGWEVHILPITPVAPTSAGLTYQYSAAQLQQIVDINTYLRTVAAPRYGEFNDLYQIGVRYPEFLDPTNSTYYVAGDGLHQNDAGRTLIADFIAAVVTP